MLEYFFTSFQIKLILFYSAAFFFCLLVFSVLITFFKRLLNERADKKMKELSGRYSNIINRIAQKTIKDGEIKSAVLKKDFRYFEMFLFNDAADGEKDAAPYAYAALISGFRDHLIKKIKNVSDWEKAKALRTLSYFKDNRNIPLFRDELQKNKFKPALIASALGLALLKDVESFEEIIKKIYSDNPPNRDIILNILFSFGKAVCPRVNGLLKKENFPDALTGLLIDFLAYNKHTPALETIENMILKTDKTDTLIHIIEAIGLLGDESSVNKIIPFKTHKDFRVRLKTVNAVGRLAKEKHLNTIEEFIYDDDWWVRRNAAETILKSGDRGIEILKELLKKEDEKVKKTVSLILQEHKFKRIRALYADRVD